MRTRARDAGVIGALWLSLAGCTEHGQTPPDGGFKDDAPPDAFACLDDSAFEPNDTIQSAFQTPVASQATSFAALASICPELDHDNYALTIASPSTVKVTTTWESGEPVDVSILNAGGTALGNGVAVSGANATCVCLNFLPAGTYFASASAAATVTNNYRLEIAIATAADCTAAPACN